MNRRSPPVVSVSRTFRACLRPAAIRSSVLLVSGALLVVAHPDVVAKPKPKVLNCAYRDAVVFRDRNKNGILDSDEPNRNTGAKGEFQALGGKGVLTLIGGVDLVTGVTNDRVLTTPNNSKGLGSLTALWQALLDRKQSEKKIKKLLGLPGKATLANFSVGQPSQSSATTSALQKKDAEIDVLAKFSGAIASSGRLGLKLDASLIAAALRGKVRAGEDPVIGAIADALLGLKQGKVDFTSQATNQQILQSAVTQLGGTVAPGDLAIVATVTAGINRLIEAQPAKFDALRQIATEGAALAKSGDFTSLGALYTGAALEQQLGSIYVPTAAITSITDDAGASVDFSNILACTQDNTLTLRGTAGPGVTQVEIFSASAPLDAPSPTDYQTSIAKVPVTGGTWSFTTNPLVDGGHGFVALSYLPSGVGGVTGNAYAVCVDTRVASAPTPAPEPPAPPAGKSLRITRVSVASDGSQSNYGFNSEYAPSLVLSADGRFVAFSSTASDLVAGDTNGRADVFLHDTLRGTTTRVSVASDGSEGNSGSGYYSGGVSISADGRFVAFGSSVTSPTSI